MKRICRGKEPEELSDYRRANPAGDWETLRNETPHLYEMIRRQCTADQGYLCGFCEIRLPETSMAQRLEHFHPKSDKSTDHNWALDWNNILGVCLGGCNPALGSYPGQYREPLPQNLSCDAHKDHLIGKGAVPPSCEGHLLNPMELMAFPCLFDLDKRTGELIPDSSNCEGVTISPNHYSTTEELVENTITVLNLNCDRLKVQRRQVLFSIEHEKKKARERRQTASQFLSSLAKRYFSAKWPSFFTTKRILLGRYAEAYLQSISFNG